MCISKNKKGKQCKSDSYLLFYCKLHWKKKVFNWKSLLYLILLSLLFIYNNYSTTKEIIGDIKEATEEVSPISFCKEDGNYRGTIPATIKIKDGVFPKFRLTAMALDGLGPVDMAFPKETLNSSSKICFEEIVLYDENQCNLSFRLNEDNFLVVSMVMFDMYGCKVGEIVDNEILLNEDCIFTFNSDSLAFEIINNYSGVILSLEYILPDTIAVRGLIIGSKKVHVMLDDHLIINEIDSLNAADLKFIDNHLKQIKPIFQYVGNDWFGKRANY